VDEYKELLQFVWTINYMSVKQVRIQTPRDIHMYIV